MGFFDKFINNKETVQVSVETQNELFGLITQDVDQIKLEKMGQGGLGESIKAKIINSICGEKLDAAKDKRIREIIDMGISFGIPFDDIALEIIRLKYPKFKKPSN